MRTTPLFFQAIVFALLLLFIVAPGTSAQRTTQGDQAAQPREALLNSDDVYWDDQFALLGVNGTVYAVATSGTDVYVGGYFTTAGGVMANGIAKWDVSTNRWSALGNGLGSKYPYAGSVYAIAVSGSDVYVGGYFATAGGVSANNIAKWNGSTNSWSALGSGVDSTVSAIAVSGSDVYVGGSFWTAGGISAQGIAKWDASTNTWSALAGGLRAPLVPPTPSTMLLPAPTAVPPPTAVATPPPPPKPIAYVYAIALSGSDVYVGGNFATAGGGSANNIAKWDGATSSWSALGSGVTGTVRAIMVSGSAVYVGGSFSSVGGITASNIAAWDSSTSTWSALGNGVAGTINALAMNGSNVYVAGSFSAAGSVSANEIARWDGTAWSALSSGIAGGYYSPMVYAVGVSGSNLYAGGEFTLAGGTPANYIARWDGGGWSALGSGASNGVAGKVSAIVVSGSDMYVGGSFTAAGTARANNIAKWNGVTHSWSGLDNGVETRSGYFRRSAAVLAIAMNGTDVYVGGGFDTAGGVSANNIAKWNGTTNSWSALGDGVGGTVYAIAASGNDTYVGGNFTSVNGMSVSRIAKWNGSTGTWTALGTGVGGASSPSVYTIAVSGDNVYVGGNFMTAGNVSARGVAKWDASTNSWSAVGGGVDDAYGSVSAIVLRGSDVYVGGSFNSIGGVSAQNIAKWNGNTWSALGSGVNGTVTAIGASGSAVYAGGYFSTAGGANASNLAVWNGCGWWSLGSGTDNQVSAIAVSGSDVYVGGNFTTAGAKPSANFGRWSKSAPSNCFYYYFPTMFK